MRRGFTLIELLVVIAIIAILAAILFPVFAKAREKARQTKCTNNQRQIVLAATMYAQDHDEMLPEASTFWQDVKLDKETLVCPSKARIPNGYMFNGAPKDFHLSAKALGKVNNPDLAMLCCDGKLPSIPDGWQSTVPDTNMLGGGHATSEIIDYPRHAGGVIIGFLDGHVAYSKNQSEIDNAFYIGSAGLPVYTVGTNGVTAIAYDDGSYGGPWAGWGDVVTSVPGTVPITGKMALKLSGPNWYNYENSISYSWTDDNVAMKFWYYIPTGTTFNRLAMTVTPDAANCKGAFWGTSPWAGNGNNNVVYCATPALTYINTPMVTGAWTQITLKRTDCGITTGGSPNFSNVYRVWPLFVGTGSMYIDGWRFESLQ